VAQSSLVIATAGTPLDLIYDNNAIFFTDGSDSTVHKVGVDGGTVTTLATGQAKPVRLASDGTYVYWSSNLGGAILRTREDATGTYAVLAPANQPWGIAVDSTNVYWDDSGSGLLMSAPKAGGTPTVVTPLEPSDSDLLLVGNVLYAGNAAGVYSIPLPNGPATKTTFTASTYLATGGRDLYVNETNSVACDDMIYGTISGVFTNGLGIAADACAFYTLRANPPVLYMVVHPAGPGGYNTQYYNAVSFGQFGPYDNFFLPARMAVDSTRVFWFTSVNGDIYRSLKPQ
jgi:hypothetical protein